MKPQILSVLLMLSPLPVMAADDAPEPPLFDGDQPPAAAEDQLQPEVTIREEKDRQVREYRINGRLYMIEIRPSHGKPYYLIDTDGDGTMETRHSELDPRFKVPTWVLMQW